MKYDSLGAANGRAVYLFTYDEGAAAAGAPPGYSAAAVFLQPGWQTADLVWLLNALYGGLDDWTEFDPQSGTRSFSFYGERADEASNVCDALAFAWSRGTDADYENVMASSHDERTEGDFVEAMFSGEILSGEAFAGKLENLIFAVKDPEQAHKSAPVINDAIARHSLD